MNIESKKATSLMRRAKKFFLSFCLLFLLSQPFLLAADIYYKGKISPFRILIKSDSALYETNFFEVIIEHWQQAPAWHQKTKFIYRIKDMTDVATTGRVSSSYYHPLSPYSSSYWVQEYIIRGVPFSWDSRKKKWKNRALHLEEKRAREKLRYRFLGSFLRINIGGIDIKSLKFLGEEEKNGKSCYLISYAYDPGLYKRWGVMAKLKAKLWVNKESFLPVKKRIEGNVAGFKWLEIITYQKYNQEFEFNLPPFVAKEAQEEKKALQDKVKEVIEAVAKIRGWQSSEVSDINIEFAKRSRIRKAMLKDLDTYYTAESLAYEGQVQKWLGLIPQDADYRDIIYNSSDAALILGLYSPRLKTIFVADDVEPAKAEVVLAHELAHAFQDKKLGLEALHKAMRDDFNAIFALACLTEGEAVAVQLQYLLNKDNENLKEWKDISRLVDEQILQGYLQDKVLYNQYGYGAIFIQNYLQAHNWRWQELENLYRNYPRSMEDIMHPQEYNVKLMVKEAGKDWLKPLGTLELPRLRQWNKVYSLRLGEYIFFVFLDKELDKQKAQEASLGWKNDRVGIYENPDGKSLIVLTSKWDTSQDAQEFYRAYRDWLKQKKFTPKNSISSSQKVQKVVFSGPKDMGVTACVLQGNRVTVVSAETLTSKEIENVVEQISHSSRFKKTKEKRELEPAAESQKTSEELGVFTTFLIGVLALIILGIYVYLAITLQIIARKTAVKNAWFAWVPILNLILMCDIAQKPRWWSALFLLSFIPYLNVIAVSIILILLWMKIAQRLNKPNWTGILVPIPLVGFIVIGYLAFSSKIATPEVKEENNLNLEK